MAGHLQLRTYLVHQRPPVEVLVDGRWRRGELRMWTQHADRTWHAQVSWAKVPGMTHIDTFPANSVRPATWRTAAKPVEPLLLFRWWRGRRGGAVLVVQRRRGQVVRAPVSGGPGVGGGSGAGRLLAFLAETYKDQYVVDTTGLESVGGSGSRAAAVDTAVPTGQPLVPPGAGGLTQPGTSPATELGSLGLVVAMPRALR